MGKLWDIVQAHIDSSPYPPSERAVAAKLGISPTALSNWKNPKKLPDRENLRSLAQLAGVPYRVVLSAALDDTGYLDPEGGAAVVPIRRVSVEQTFDQSATVNDERAVAFEDDPALDEEIEAQQQEP